MLVQFVFSSLFCFLPLRFFVVYYQIFCFKLFLSVSCSPTIRPSLARQFLFTLHQCFQRILVKGEKESKSGRTRTGDTVASRHPLEFIFDTSILSGMRAIWLKPLDTSSVFSRLSPVANSVLCGWTHGSTARWRGRSNVGTTKRVSVSCCWRT